MNLELMPNCRKLNMVCRVRRFEEIVKWFVSSHLVTKQIMVHKIHKRRTYMGVDGYYKKQSWDNIQKKKKAPRLGH